MFRFLSRRPPVSFPNIPAPPVLEPASEGPSVKHASVCDVCTFIRLCRMLKPEIDFLGVTNKCTGMHRKLQMYVPNGFKTEWG